MLRSAEAVLRLAARDAQGAQATKQSIYRDARYVPLRVGMTVTYRPSHFGGRFSANAFGPSM